MLEAMAEAVEKAAVVLVCLTQKYKESPNCRTGLCTFPRIQGDHVISLSDTFLPPWLTLGLFSLPPNASHTSTGG